MSDIIVPDIDRVADFFKRVFSFKCTYVADGHTIHVPTFPTSTKFIQGDSRPNQTLLITIGCLQKDGTFAALDHNTQEFGLVFDAVAMTTCPLTGRVPFDTNLGFGFELCIIFT